MEFVYTPDGKKLIVGNSFGSAVVLNRESRTALARFDPPRTFQRSDVLPAISTMAVDPSGEIVASNTQDSYPNPLAPAGAPKKSVSRIDLWQTKDGVLLKTLEWPGGHVVTLAFQPGGSDLAALDADGALTVWDWRTGAKRFAAKSAPGYTVKVGLAYAPDGSRLVQSAGGGEIRILDAKTGEVRQHWIGHGPAPIGGGTVGASVSSLAFRPDGTLATVGSDAAIRLWRPDAKGQYQPLAVWSIAKLASYRGRLLPPPQIGSAVPRGTTSAAKLRHGGSSPVLAGWRVPGGSGESAFPFASSTSKRRCAR